MKIEIAGHAALRSCAHVILFFIAIHHIETFQSIHKQKEWTW